jgi:RNA polymerase sigma factor (sigma-70 family)
MADPALRALARRLRRAVSRTPLAPRSDSALLARFAEARDESAFAELVGRYGRLVRNVCRNVLADEHDAEEAMQATFLLLARRAGSLRQPEALAGWLHGAARQIALRSRRAVARRRARESQARPAPPPAPGPVAEASWRELQAMLDEELARLPERLRTPFALCCLEGYGHGEAARLLGWKTGTVSGRLAEARKLLRQRLARRGVSLSAVLGGLTLAGGGVRAGLPAARVSEIVAAALQFASGVEAGPAGRLAGDVLRGAPWNHLRAFAAVAALLGVLAVGLGVNLLSPGAHTAGPGPVAVRLPVPAEVGRPHLDRFGDPLPDGAIARLGTKRFGHDYYTESAVWSPDGKVIASLGGNSVGRPLCLWDAATGKELHQLAATAPVLTAAFSPDGKTLATAEDGRGIVLWDVASGKEVTRFTGQGDGVAVAFAPDGRSLAAAGRGGAIQVREVASGRLAVELQAGANSLLRRVAYSPDGQTLASTGSDGAVILWDLAKGTERWRKKPHGDWAFGLAFSPDGKALASTGADSVIRVWDASTGKSLRSFGNAVKYGLIIAYSPDGRTLASPGPGDCVCLWDPSTGEEKRRWHTGEAWVQSVCYSPDGRTLATTGFCGSRVRLWDPETGAELRPAAGHNTPIHGLWFGPDGKTVWSVAGDNAVIRWDVASGKGRSLPEAHPVGETQAFAVSPDGRTLATDGPDGSVWLWDADGHALGTLCGHAGTLQMIAFSPDGKVLASSGTDRTVRFWDVATRRELHRTEVPGGLWGCLSFSADGRKLALAGGRQDPAPGSAPRVLDVQTGKEIFRLESPPPAPGVGAAPEEFVSFCPDGRTLATVGYHGDKVARIWDATTGKLVGQCVGDTRCRLWVSTAFSPDGRYLATGPYDRDDAVRLWDVATFREVARLRGHHGGVFALAFSPDGRFLASGGGDATILVWDLAGQAAGRDERSRQRRRAVTAPGYGATPEARQLLQTPADAKAQTRPAGEARPALARPDGPP